MISSHILNSIFTFKLTNSKDARRLNLIFSDYIQSKSEGSNLVYNISCRPIVLLTLINSTLNKILISNITIFNIYLFYPSSGFRVFNIKIEMQNKINQVDFELFKMQVLNCNYETN